MAGSSGSGSAAVERAIAACHEHLREQHPTTPPPQDIPQDGAYKTKLCALYKTADCINGRGCRFAHGESELRRSRPERPREELHTYAGKYKTQLCQRFAQGFCAKGDSCSFAHGESELRVLEKPVCQRTATYKTVLCQQFAISSSCARGDFCSFAHGSGELRSSPHQAQAEWGNYKTQLCRNFAAGFCPHGGACRFAHGSEEIRANSQTLGTAHVAAGSLRHYFPAPELLWSGYGGVVSVDVYAAVSGHLATSLVLGHDSKLDVPVAVYQ
jgi:hypothetical protein